jgi:RNA polymerase sigma-70 factor, ECF subfamily
MVNRELLDRLRRGDPQAFEELVEETHRRVFTLAYRLVGDRHEAEDVAQDAYLKVYRSIRGFRGDASFDTWLYRIVSNTAITHLRRRGRFGELTEDADQIVRLPEPGAAADPVDRDEVRRALASLPAGQRSVLMLKDVYGFSCAEIGEQMGLTEGAVKVRLHRARKRLKDLVYGPAEEPALQEHQEVRARLPEYVEAVHG